MFKIITPTIAAGPSKALAHGRRLGKVVIVTFGGLSVKLEEGPGSNAWRLSEGLVRANGAV